MSELAGRIDQQWKRAMRWGPYGLLALASGIAAMTVDAFDNQNQIGLMIALVVLAAGLHWFCADRRWGGPLDDGLGRAYLVIRTVIAFALTWINPFYAIYAVVGYFDPHLYVGRRWIRVSLIATAVIMAGSQSGGLPPTEPMQAVAFGALFVLNAGLSVLFGNIAVQEEDLAAERIATIAELESTNARLAEALEENAALQERLVDQARESGVHDERERLAIEIHDTIAQSLTGIVTQLQAAEESVDGAAAHDHRKRAAELAREALGEARRSVQGLLPTRLDRTDLVDALGWLVSDWSGATGIPGEVVVTGEAEPIHRDVETTVLRVAQEALANVGKHSAARRVGVTLSYMDDELALDVRDDGDGFDPARVRPSSPSGGVGLHGMRQRAARVAGELVVESERGAGTAVSLRVPAVRRG